MKNTIILLQAQLNNACDLLGCNQYTGNIKPNSAIQTQLANILRYGLGLVFAGIIIFGIFLTIKAAVTIINSDGNQGKVEEGYKTIKGLFIGVLIILAGILGIIVLIGVFGAGGIFGTQVNPPDGTKIPVINQ